MPRGDKSAYTDKQERKADHIADGYRTRACRPMRPSGAPGPPSKDDGGGKKSGSGRDPQTQRRAHRQRERPTVRVTGGDRQSDAVCAANS
jgi:hypothetical protein